MEIFLRPVATWSFALALDRKAGAPLPAQIARAIADDVRRGRLHPGQRLPGSRSLAASLGVHRNTVLAAYDELGAEGWLATTEAQGTFVSEAMPDAKPRRIAGAGSERAEVPARSPLELGPGPPDHRTWRHQATSTGMLALSGGLPDVRLVPWPLLARAYRRALRGGARALLTYGDSRGHVRLRTALARMLSETRALAAGADDVLVTRGSQMALDLIARALVRPGDVIAVENPGYRPAWEALRLAGATLAPVRVDAGGLCVGDLAALGPRLRAVYVTSHHQYPTTVTLSAPRRLALLELARTRRFAIIEDDYDNEFHYEARPVLPLASVDRAGVVIYVGTLSKVLAPGLRLGYVVCARELLDRMTALRAFVDLQGDHAVEVAVAELLEDGEVQRHVRRVRRVYKARREALVRALERHLPGAFEYALPTGGMALWARAAKGCDVAAWVARAEAVGATFQVERRFDFDGRSGRHVRLGYAVLDEREIAEAVKRIASVRSAPRARRPAAR